MLPRCWNLKTLGCGCCCQTCCKYLTQQQTRLWSAAASIDPSLFWLLDSWLRYHFAYLCCIKSCDCILLLRFWVQEILEQNWHSCLGNNGRGGVWQQQVRTFKDSSSQNSVPQFGQVGGGEGINLCYCQEKSDSSLFPFHPFWLQMSNLSAEQQFQRVLLVTDVTCNSSPRTRLLMSAGNVSVRQLWFNC